MIPDLYEALSWTEAGVSVPGTFEFVSFAQWWDYNLGGFGNAR